MVYVTPSEAFATGGIVKLVTEEPVLAME